MIDADGACGRIGGDVLDAFAAMGREAHALRRRTRRSACCTRTASRSSPQGDRDTRGHGDSTSFPLLIDPDEWAAIELGLIQRARLLNALLVDLYGEQRVLKDRLLPPGLVFGNPHFLRPCTASARATTCTCTSSRSISRARPDGRWWVLSDRTQAPSGAGYALENRIVVVAVLARALPRAQRAPARELLPRVHASDSSASAAAITPLAVFLTPGPSTQTYFEHAYLARYLGFSVVEGADLTVRDDRVYLKTLDGLKPVDSILRRISAELCDPLELRTDSMLGVPGPAAGGARAASVVDRQRARQRASSRATRSCASCRALRRTSSTRSSRCRASPRGGAASRAEREYVLRHLDRLVVRRIRSARSLFACGEGGARDARADADERERLVHAIERSGTTSSARNRPRCRPRRSGPARARCRPRPSRCASTSPRPTRATR